MDIFSLCKAAQVNKQWRNIIDGHGITWKKRLLLGGYNLTESEEKRAISENWRMPNFLIFPYNSNTLALPLATDHPYKEIYRRHHESNNSCSDVSPDISSSYYWLWTVVLTFIEEVDILCYQIKDLY